MNLMTQSYTTIPINRLYAPSSIDYDPEYGRIYLADPRLRQIVSVHFDGTDAREVRQLNMGVCGGVWVDEVISMSVTTFFTLFLKTILSYHAYRHNNYNSLHYIYRYASHV